MKYAKFNSQNNFIEFTDYLLKTAEGNKYFYYEVREEDDKDINKAYISDLGVKVFMAGELVIEKIEKMSLIKRIYLAIKNNYKEELTK